MPDASTLDIATHLLDAGLSVIPIREGGSKRPACSWKAYQSDLPAHADLRRWFRSKGYDALAVVCGAVSASSDADALECIDFDDPDVYPAWRERVQDFAPDLVGRLAVVTTPSGGRHVWYRYSFSAGSPAGNDKLATGADGKVRIETRGEGGYALVPGSPGYAMQQGKLTRLPDLTAEERDLLLHVAKSYDEAPREKRNISAKTSGDDGGGGTQESSGERPGTAFDREGWPQCRQLLTDRGWEHIRTRSNDVEEWRRPGKGRGEGISATFGHATGEDGAPRFYVFSTNGRPFEADRTYSPFAVYALLEHGGDFSEAGKTLQEEGYGHSLASDGRPASAGHPSGDGAAGSAPEAEQAATDAETWPYGVDDEGRMYYVKTYKSRPPDIQKIADFRAQISREVRTEGGELIFELRGETTAGRPFEAEVDATAFEDPRRLSATLRGAAGANTRVYHRMSSHLPTAVSSLSSDLDRLTRYERTGWAHIDEEGKEEGLRFLIPGRAPDGTEIDVTGVSYVHTAHLGEAEDEAGSADLIDEGREALSGLLEAHDPTVGTILLSHLLLPPLAKRAGLAGHRYALLVHGLTGTLKTSWAMAGMCLWGRGFAEDKHLIKWGQGTTTNALIALAAQAHDLPFLIDNYKRGTGRGAGDLIEFVHAALEGGEKRRLNRASQLKDAKELRTWPIMTGEDVPDTDPATLARMLVVRPRLPSDSGGYNEALARAQRRPVALERSGAAWLRFLESDDGRKAAEQMAERFPELRSGYAEALRKEREDMANPLRVASSLALNQMCYQIASERCEALAPALSEHTDAHREGLADLGKEMASYGSQSREASRWLDALEGLISAGEVRVKPLGEPAGSNVPGTPFIGWESPSNDTLYLVPSAVRRAVGAALDAQGEGLGGLSARALYEQLDELGAFKTTGGKKTTKQKKINGTNHRCLWLRRSAVIDNAATADGDSNGREGDQQAGMPF